MRSDANYLINEIQRKDIQWKLNRNFVTWCRKFHRRNLIGETLNFVFTAFANSNTFIINFPKGKHRWRLRRIVKWNKIAKVRIERQGQLELCPQMQNRKLAKCREFAQISSVSKRKKERKKEGEKRLDRDDRREGRRTRSRMASVRSRKGAWY